MSGQKARLIAGTAILAALSAPSFADQPMSARSDSIAPSGIQGMAAPKYSRTTPMGGVDYGDDMGSHTATKNIDMSTFGIYNLKDPELSRPDMAANKGYVDAQVAAGKDNLGNHTAERNLDMDGHEIRDVGNPTSNTSAANKKYVDDQVAAGKDNLGNHVATQAVDMENHRIVDLASPIDANDAATKSYVDNVGLASQDNLGNHTATMILNMSGQKITNLAEPTAATDAATKNYVDASSTTINNSISSLTGRKITGANGILGGGDLSADRQFTLDTAWLNARWAQVGRTISAGDGLSGGGTLAANRTLSVDGTVVRTTGKQSIAGEKIFSDGIDNGGKLLTNVATPANSSDATNKGYVDTLVTNSITAAAYTAGTGLTLTGREFSINPSVVATLGGTQTFTAAKTFDVATQFAAPSNQLRLRSRTTGAGVILNTNGTVFDMLVTASGQAANGAPSALRPLSVNMASGAVSMAHGLTVSGNVNVQGGKVAGLGLPTNGTDATSKSYVDGLIADAMTNGNYTAGTGISISGKVISAATTLVTTDTTQTISGAKTFSSAINMSDQRITNVGDPTASHHAVNRRYLEAQIAAAATDPYTAGSGITISAANVVALDATVLRTTGAQTAAGKKTFSDGISNGDKVLTNVATPTASHHATNKSYVDAQIAASATAPYTAGSGVTINASNVVAIDGTVVRTTGAQAITGVKTFSDGINNGGKVLTNVATPVANTDAANKNYVDTAVGGSAPTTRAINTNNGLTGGGNLSADRTLGLTGQALALHNLGSNGLVARTAAGAFAARAITAASAGGLMITDGNGVAGNPTLSVDGTVVRTTGAQTITGVKTFSDGINNGGKVLANVATPTAAAHAANKSYVDSSISTAVTAAAYSAGNGLNLIGREFSVDTGVVATLAGTQTFTGINSFTRPVNVTENGYQIRLKHVTASSSAAILSNSGGSFSVHFTNPGAQDGGANALLPFSINNTTGLVNMGHGLRVVGGATIVGGLEMSSSKITNLAAPTAAFDATNKNYVDSAVAGRALTTRTLTAGNGLTGGGDLTANRSFAIDNTVVATLAGAQTFTGAKTFSAGIAMGNTKITGLATPTANADAATKAYVDAAVSGASGGVPTTRTIATNNGLTGGGDLSANRTLGLTGNALGLHNLAANGIVTRTAAGVMTARSVAAGAGLAVTNGDGVAGNPTVALAGQALAVHNLATNGMVVRTAAGAVEARSLVAGTGIAVTNANAVAGNPTIAVADNYIRRVPGNANVGVLAYGGGTSSPSNFDGSTTNPTGTTRLNYSGYLYATRFYSSMYLYFSDRNLKENIQTISPSEGIATIRKANPVSYHWKDTGHKALGLIAQEVEEIIPTAVKTNEEGIKSVDYVQMIAPMLAAIQELDERVQKLEAEKAEKAE